MEDSIKVGELFFGLEDAEEPFPFGAEFSFTAFTIFGTRYELRWGSREIDESALKATSGGGREMTNKAYSSLVSKWGVPGTGDHWTASYFVGDVDEDVAFGVSLDEAMVACSHHYRQMLMTAMAEVGVLVAGLPMLPPEDSADFSEDDVENWTPAGD